jgi:hypothetical protein
MRAMTRVTRWYHERPRRPPAEIACLLARDRFWRDEGRRLIGTHPEFPDAEWVLETEAEVGHALVLVLSRLPARRRAGFAAAFYEGRTQGRAASVSSDPHARLALAASVALLVVELARPELRSERVVDLLQGAAQGDDVTATTRPALLELAGAIAQARVDIELEDPTDPEGTATRAVIEVLDPAGDIVALRSVVSHAAWTAVESRDESGTLDFMRALDRLFTA